MADSTSPLPTKRSRTSTHAIATPMTELIAATASESHSERNIASSAAGAVIAFQNVRQSAETRQRQISAPAPWVETSRVRPWQTSAAIGMRTMRER